MANGNETESNYHQYCTTNESVLSTGVQTFATKDQYSDQLASQKKSSHVIVRRIGDENHEMVVLTQNAKVLYNCLVGFLKKAIGGLSLEFCSGKNCSGEQNFQ